MAQTGPNLQNPDLYPEGTPPQWQTMNWMTEGTYYRREGGGAADDGRGGGAMQGQASGLGLVQAPTTGMQDALGLLMEKMAMLESEVRAIKARL